MGVGGIPEHFLGGRVWPALTKAAKQSSRRSYVAVAYFGKSATKLLPIRRGSYLVVDASDSAVKAGQTCPSSLEPLLEKGVRIYSSESLHAKVFVFGNVALVGSANVSNNSKDTLFEALISTRDRKTVALARQFVRDHCLESLGPEEIKRLKKIYRTPIASVSKAKKQPHAILRIVRLTDYKLPASREEQYIRAEKAAKKKIGSRTHRPYDLYWSSKHKFFEGEFILPVFKDAKGVSFVSPPGKVTSISQFEDGLGHPTMIFLEMPDRRRIRLNELIRRVGRQYKANLETGRVIRDITLVSLISDIFRPRGE